jgi:hypothetical protein
MSDDTIIGVLVVFFGGFEFLSLINVGTGAGIMEL